MEELSTARLYVLRATIWVTAFGLPRWLTDQLVGPTAETMAQCLMDVVLVPPVLPWGYVMRHYLRAPGDRWGGAAAPS